MICRHCGTKIDTGIRGRDGSVTCTGCGAVYRRKSSIAQQGAKGSHKSDSQIRAPRTERMHPERDVGRVASQPHLEKIATKQKRRKKKGNLVVVLLLAILIVASTIGGVGIIIHNKSAEKNQVANPVITPPPENITNSPTASANIAPSNTPKPVAQVSATNTVAKKKYRITMALSDYVDERAWVLYKDDNQNDYYGVIDLEGNVIWSIENSNLKNWWGSVTTKSYEGGINCIYCMESTVTTSTTRATPGMIVIAKNGDIIFDSREADDGASYYYLGYGDGTILAIQNYADFTRNVYYICEIDLSGQIISKVEWNNKNKFYDDFEYIGNNLLYGGWTTYTLGGEGFGIYNRSTHSFIDLGGIEIFDSDSGEVYIGGRKGVWDRIDELWAIHVGYLSSSDSWKEFSKDNFRFPCKEVEYTCVSEGIIICHKGNTRGLYNYYGKLVAQFPDEWNISEIHGFSGGYAPVVFRGPDGNNYFTIIDTEGNIQYSPIIIKDFEYREHKDKAYYPAYWNGYCYVKTDREYVIINPQGVETTRTELDAISNNYSVGEVLVCDGMERMYDSQKRTYNSYRSSNGNIVDSVLVGNTSGSGNSGYQANSTQTSSISTQKSYTLPSNFSIEGKWKNVGTYSFGQVQNGAIVSFDGTNCNFYSPKDTYSFYKNEDHFILDCTSLLFSETLSFEVKIVDDDHIDIYYGSNYLELARTS